MASKNKATAAIATSIALPAKTIASLTARMPANIAILVKGPTGVGKSFLARDVADTLGLPLIDVRGSTMDEAGVTGIPDFEGSKEAGVSYFLATSWFQRACREPVVLFLDELNRSMPQVMQSFFQIVLDRELGNDKNGTPRRLHPETRVWAAINAGNEYDVNEMDPALLRRFWTVELETSAVDWVSWAESKGIARAITDFIRNNPNELRVDPSTVASGTTCPNPASWDRLNHTLAHMNWNPDQYIGQNVPDGFYALCAGFVGSAATAKFVDHIKSMLADLTAEDILKRFAKVQAYVDRNDATQVNKLVERLGAYFCEGNLLLDSQAKNLVAFFDHVGGEAMFRFWTVIGSSRDANMVRSLHKHIGAKVAQLAAAAHGMAK